MPYMYYSPDSMWTYVLIVLPAVLIALWASANVNSTFKKYAQIPSTSGFTGADAARRILDANGLTHIRIEHVNGKLTDHYDPKAEVIRLSDSVTTTAVRQPSVLRRTRRDTRCSTPKGISRLWYATPLFRSATLVRILRCRSSF